jgi:hypothetical protein
MQCLAGAAAAAAPAAWRGDPPAASSLPLLPSGEVDYRSIDSQPQSLVLIAVLRKLLVAEHGSDVSPAVRWSRFEGLMPVVRAVNERPGSAASVQAAARRVFQGILPSLGLGWVPAAWRAAVRPNFPDWLLHGAFYVVFSTLFPWLMGPLAGVEHVDVSPPAALMPLLRALRLPTLWRVPQGIKAERCRFLEASQCASVCFNSCKAPSQSWLGDDFGLPLHIQPNYADFSCVWSFGKPAPALEADEALMVPCFTRCASSDKGKKDASRQAARLRTGFGVVAGVDTFTGERLEAIAARATAAALADARAPALTEAEAAAAAADLGSRSAAVAQDGKCWSVDDAREALRAEAAR